MSLRSPGQRRLWPAVALALRSSEIDIDESATTALRQFIEAGDETLTEALQVVRGLDPRKAPSWNVPSEVRSVFVDTFLESEGFSEELILEPDTVLEARAVAGALQIFAVVLAMAGEPSGVTEMSILELRDRICPLWPFC